MSKDRKNWQPFNLHLIYVGCDVMHNGNTRRKGWKGRILSIKDNNVLVEWVHNLEGLSLGNARTGYTLDFANNSFLIAPVDGEQPSAKESQYIVWTPDSDLPPRKVMTSDEADKAIASMANRYPSKVFYKCKLERKAVTQSLIIEDL